MGQTISEVKKHVGRFFLTAIWLPHGQLWAIIEEAAFRFWSQRLNPLGHSPQMESNIRNVVVSAKNKKNTVYFSGLAVRNDKYDKKGKEVNVILKKNVIMKIFFCW